MIDQASGKTVFLLQAPVCYDAGGQRLEAAVELSPSGEGTLLRYVLEADALDNAAYPITIDPIVLDRLTSEGVELVNLRPPLSEGDSGQVDEEYLKIGGTGTQEHIALMRFNQLAVLGSGDQVTRARLRLRTYDFAESAIICAHKVNGNWEKASVGWNTLMEAGKVDDAVLDYAKGVSSGPVYFDLSNLYREWYESDGNGASKNYGVVLRRGHEADMASGIQQFYKTGSGQDYMPTLIVSYMSHSGVEGYWSYESQSAGRAGTMSVDLFGGNMILEHPDTAMTGTRNPVSVSHYYNSCQGAITAQSESEQEAAQAQSEEAPTVYSPVDYRCGPGWKHSALQYIYEYSAESGPNETKKEYLVWVDGDGTEHWFPKTGSQPYKDEEGMLLEIKQYNADANYPQRWVIKDRAGNGMCFQRKRALNTQGQWERYWLTRTWNALRERTTATYRYEEPQSDTNEGMKAVEGKLLEITDAVGRKTTFTYNAAGLLERIQIPDKGESSRSVSYTYDALQRLVRVNYSDLGAQQYTSYSYSGDGYLLTQAANYDGLQVTAEYETLSNRYIEPGTDSRTADAMRRVIGLKTEHQGSQGVQYGVRKLFAYEGMRTAVTVVEGTSETATEGKKLIYQFNDRGNLTSVRDELGYGQFCEYEAGEDLPNSPTGSSKVQKAVMNRLRSPDLSVGWTSTAGGGTAVKDTSAQGRCMGVPSMKLSRSASGVSSYQPAESVSLEGGKRWTLSAYVKAETVQGDAYMRVRVNQGQWQEGPKMTGSTPAKEENGLATDGWQRQELRFETPEGGAAQVEVQFVHGGSGGTVWYACPQLEEGETANSVNLLSNGDFRRSETGTDVMPQDWTGEHLAEPEGANPRSYVKGPEASQGGDPFPSALGGNILEFEGVANKARNFYQELDISGAKDDLFFLGGWANGKSVPGASDDERGFRLSVKFVNGSSEEYGGKIHYNCNWVGWQYVGGAVKAPTAYDKVKVYAVYMRNSNWVQFSNLFLHREAFGKSFAYGTDRNLESMGTLAGTNTHLSYDGQHNVTGYREAGRSSGVSHSLSYGDTAEEREKHLLKSHVTPEGIRSPNESERIQPVKRRDEQHEENHVPLFDPDDGNLCGGVGAGGLWG